MFVHFFETLRPHLNSKLMKKGNMIRIFNFVKRVAGKVRAKKFSTKSDGKI